MAEWCADVDADAPSLHGELRRLVLGACDLESTGDSAHQHAGIAQPAVRRLHSRAQIGLADSFELVTPLGGDPMHVQRAARSGVKKISPFAHHSSPIPRRALFTQRHGTHEGSSVE